MKEQAAGVLWSLAANAANKTLMSAHHVLAALLALCQSGMGWEVQAHACGALRSLAVNDECAKGVVELGGTNVILELLR